MLLYRFIAPLLLATVTSLLATTTRAATPAAMPDVPRLRVTSDTAVVLAVDQAHWHLAGPFAEEVVQVTLRNQGARAAEATLLVPLASEQRLKSYALDIDGQLRDAVPVERVKARTTFEQTVRRSVDPALAEKDEGNAYRIRVFPVPAGEVRHVRIVIASLANRVACGWQHVLESPALQAQAIPVQVTAESRAVSSSSLLAWQDAAGKGVVAQARLGRGVASLGVCLAAPTDHASYSAQLGEHPVQWLEVQATGKPTPRARVKRLEIVWDASLSMPRERNAELQLLAQYLARRDVDVTLTVLRNDIVRSTLEVRDGNIDRLRAQLEAQSRDGATALRTWRPAQDAEEVLVFSDATSTWPAGELASPDVPVFVISQSVADPAVAQALVRHGGAVIDLGRTSRSEALAQLTHFPAARWQLGAGDKAWQVPSLVSQGGVLRACHIGASSDSGFGITLSRGAANGNVQSRMERFASAASNPMAAFWCATWWMDSLQAEPEAHRTELAELGQRFGIPNSETDLLVLEHVEDYVMHGIEPRDADAALQAAVQRQRQHQAEARAQAVASNRDAIHQGWKAREAWWAQVFQKGAMPVVDEKKAAATALMARRNAEGSERERTADAPRHAVPPVGMAAPAPMAIEVAGAAAPVASAPVDAAPAATAATTASPVPMATMAMMSVSTDAPYVGRLLEARDSKLLYQTYLDLRETYAESPAFYFDVADRLFALGEPVLARRVLSNVLELMPREPAALRLAAYRLQQAGDNALALPLLERVRQLAPEEPQSFRDLGLAYGLQGQCQAAVDELAHVVNTPWSERFADIGVIALAEINDLKTRCPEARLDAIDPQLRAALPVGLRVTLKWDLDDTDIDLHVTDPNGETAYYAHRGTYQGGQLSRDFTAGYGPEEFVLREPKPGTYRVEVNYYGSRVAKLTRGAGVNVSLQTGFATPLVKTSQLTMRLAEKSGKILVGTFDVAASGELRVAN